MTGNIVHWVKPLTSLRLTVSCLGCAMILVFLEYLDQINIGVYEAENRYFKSFFLYLPRLALPYGFRGFPVATSLVACLW